MNSTQTACEILRKGTLLHRLPDPLDASLGAWAGCTVTVETDSAKRHVLVRHNNTQVLAIVDRNRFEVL
jgi:hypothetical protein